MEGTVLTEEMVVMDCLEGQGRREIQVFRDLKGQLDLKVKHNYHELHCREALQNMLVLIILTLNNQVSQVPVWVVQCTLGGGGSHAQTSQEHNLCMLEELLEAGGATREGEPTASAYLMTQVTCSTHLGHKLIVIIYMVQSMRPQKDHFQRFITTMYRVQCAMFPPGEQY